MSYHIWGDNWPHWDELYSAIDWFNKMYYRITSIYPMTKEKYGSMRFSCTGVWIKKREHTKVFRHLIRKMTIKFPNVIAEICHDAGCVLNDDYFCGWCAGMTFSQNHSYWSSDKRPKGV